MNEPEIQKRKRGRPKSSPEEKRERQRAKKERKDRSISEAQKGRPKSPETREKMRQGPKIKRTNRNDPHHNLLWDLLTPLGFLAHLHVQIGTRSKNRWGIKSITIDAYHPVYGIAVEIHNRHLSNEKKVFLLLHCPYVLVLHWKQVPRAREILEELGWMRSHEDARKDR